MKLVHPIEPADPHFVEIAEADLVAIREVAEQLELLHCLAVRADRPVPVDATGAMTPARVSLPVSAFAVTCGCLVQVLETALQNAERANAAGAP